MTKAIGIFITFVFGLNASAEIKVAVTVDDLPVHGRTMPLESRLQIAERFIAAFQKYGVLEAYGFINAKRLKEAPDAMEVLVVPRFKGRSSAR